MTCKGGYYVHLDGSHDRLTSLKAACFARADLAGAPGIAVLIAVISAQFTRKHVLMCGRAAQTKTAISCSIGSGRDQLSEQAITGLSLWRARWLVRLRLLGLFSKHCL